jgi:hypothetical protein
MSAQPTSTSLSAELSTSAPAGRFGATWKRPSTAFLLIVIIACVAIRTMHSGWGLAHSVFDPDQSVRFGIATGTSDYLTYSSWAQQAKKGVWTFSDLYTTTPHPAVYFNPFFLVAGWLARVFATSPEVILNASILLSLVAFVYALNSACDRLRFSALTTLCVLCLTFGGGGVTWIRRLVELLGLHGTLRSIGPADTIWGYPDWFYGELFPVVAFNVSPFHSASLALIAIVVVWLLRYDDPAQRFSGWGAGSLIGVLTFLVGLRPYEPVVLLAAYSAYLAYSLVAEPHHDRMRRRVAIFTCLCAGIVPFLAYDFWLTRQPVWNEFSQKGLDLFGGADWAGAFLVLWVLAIAGVAILSDRALHGPYALLVLWCLIYAVILVVLHSGLTKFCGGCTIPLSLLAGVAVERWIGQLRTRQQRAFVVAAVACLALGSPIVFLTRIAKSPPPRVSADLLMAVNAIRRDSDTPVPTVLTDPGTAMYLPGLAGFRVFCGNWGLTDNFHPKVGALDVAGFHSPAVILTPTEQSAEAALIREAVAGLREQIGTNVFGYLLVDGASASPGLKKFRETAEQEFGTSVLYKGPEFCAIKLDASTVKLLLAAVR